MLKTSKLEHGPKCPTCDKELDGYSDIRNSGAIMRPGDVSVCCYCGEVLELQEGGKTFKQIRGEELKKARNEIPNLRNAESLVRLFMRRYYSKK
jgi:hypothetical protein